MKGMKKVVLSGYTVEEKSEIIKKFADGSYLGKKSEEIAKTLNLLTVSELKQLSKAIKEISNGKENNLNG